MADTEEMTDGEMWRALKEQRQEKRAGNRVSSAKLLTDAGVRFEVRNSGAHLIVEGCIDFWPGTGLWMERCQYKRNYGVRTLIKRAQQLGKAGDA